MSDTLEDQDLDAQQDMQAEGGGGYGGPPLPTPPLPPGGGAGSPIRASYTPPPTAAQRWAQARAGGEPGESLGFTSQAFIPPANTAQDQGALHDFKDQALATTIGMGADVVGAVRAASQAITQSPDAEAWLSAGVTRLQDFAESYVKDMSPRAQLAAKVKLFGPAGLDDDGKPVPSAGELGWKSVILNRLAQVVPSLAFAAMPGGWVGRVVSGLAFGGMDAGGAYNQAADAFIKATPAEKMQYPVYAERIGQGRSVEQASQDNLTAMAGSITYIEHGLAGFGAGVGLSGAGGLLRGGAKGAEAAGHGALARTGIGVGEGGLILGGQAFAGAAADQTNPNQPGGAKAFDPADVALRSLEPMITGAVLGGAAHALLGKRPAPKVEPATPAIEGVDPAHSTAMAEALGMDPAAKQGELNLQQQHPPGFAPGQAQGDMFPAQGAPRTPPPPGGEAPPVTQPPGVTQDATQAGLPLRPPPPAADPSVGQGSGAQGEMFRDQSGGMTGQTPPVGIANTTQNAPNPPSGTISPAPPTIPVSKASLIRALVAAGEDINQLKDLTVTALRRKYAVSQPETAPITPAQVQRRDGVGHNEAVRRAAAENAANTPTHTPPVVSPEAGQTNIAAVSPGRVASAVEQPAGVLTSPGSEPATPPEPVVRPATAGPATLPTTVADTEPPPPVEPTRPAGDVGAAAPASLIVAPEPPAPAKVLTKAEQLRADAAAKRALEKAKLAKPGDLPILTKTHVADEASAEHGDAKVIDQEGKVVGTQNDAGTLTRTDTLTRNAPAIAGGEVTTRPMPEVAQAIHAAAGRAARMAGVEAPALVNTWTRDVTRVIQSARSETEAHQLLAEWGAQKGPATPGTKVQRAVVADKLLQLLTGKGLKARAELGRDARVEASRQASVYESEGAASKANIEERSSREQDAARQEALDHGPTEEISQGVVDHSEGVGKVARSEDTTDKTRILGDLENKIRNEGMSITEADALYGKQEGPGRRRRYPDMASWIRERITKEEDPTTRAHLEEALAKHEDPVGDALAIEDGRTIHFQRRQRHAPDDYGDSSAGSTWVVRTRPDDFPVPENPKWFEVGRFASKLEAHQVANGHRNNHDVVAEVHEEAGRAPHFQRTFKDVLANFNTGASQTRYESWYNHPDTVAARVEVDRQRKLWGAVDYHAKGTEAFREELAEPSLTPERRTRVERMLARSEAKEAIARIMAKAGGVDIAKGFPASPTMPPHFQYRATEDGIKPGSSRFTGVANDPRLNDHVGRAVLASEEHGVDYTAHDALTAIINHTGVKAEMRPMHELAKVILRWLPKDLLVMSPEQAVRDGHISSDVYDQYRRNEVFGHYAPADDYNPAHIVVDPRSPGAVETVLHEALHAVTLDHIDRLLDSDPNHPELQALQAIADELVGHGNTASHELARGTAAALHNALKNPHEILAWLLTNPGLQEFAASRQASPAFRAKMVELGFPPREQGRSVWRSFTDWVRRAVGLNAPATASEHTLLDHILRPLQDITERAGRENMARDLPRDPGLRSQAEPLYRATADSFGERAKSLWDKLPDGNDTRPYVLAATTTDGIVGRYRDLFDKLKNVTFSNPLARVRDASEAIARAGKTFSDTYQDRAQTLVAAFNARPDREAIAKLANDATIANVSLGNTRDPKANDWIKKPAQQAQLRSLEARFNQLPAESRGVYQGLRDFHHEVGATERNAALTGVLNRVFTDATDAQRKAFVKAASSHEGLEKFIADPDNSELAKAYGQEWATQRALAVGIAKVFDAGRVRGDYFPLKRFGNYVVRYGEANTPEYGVEMFERLGDATARHAELAAAGTDGLAQVDLRATSALREVTRDHPLIDQLDAALRARKDLKEHADDIRDLANRLILQASTRSEAARVRRKGVQGASVDAGRVLAHDFVATGDRIGYLEHGAERFKALADMRLVAQDLARNGAPGEAIKARQVIHELEQKITAQENPGGRLASLTRKANTFGYVQSLMSWSHILTSSIETHMNATAFLGARHGVIPTTVAMNRALAQLAPTMVAKGARNTFNAATRGLKTADWNLAQFARDKLVAGGANKAQMTQLFASLDRAGLVDHSMVRELRRIANPSGLVGNAAGRVFERFTDLMGAGGHAADVMNKSAVAKTAFDLEMKRSQGDVAQSVAYATDMVRNVTPNYNLGNKPRVATSAGPLGAFAAPIMQFKLYGLHMYSVVGNLVKASLRGATPEARAEARYAFAGVLATHAMMAGSLTLIADPLRYIGGAYDLLTGADKPHAYENDVRGFLADVFGPEIGEVVARGLPGLLGWDLHRRTGLANLLEVPGVDSFDKAGIAKMTATALSGAAGEDIGVFGQGIAKAAHGDFWGAAKDMMPRPVRDVMKAIDLGNKGVTDSQGKVILGADKLSLGNVASQALGVQPSRVSEFREARFAVQERQSEWKAERAKLEQRWLAADPGDRPSIWSDIRQWSSEHHGMGITMGQLLTNQKAARKQASQPMNHFGLRLPPKAALSLSDAGRFAPLQ